MSKNDFIPSGFIETLQAYVRERGLAATGLVNEMDSELESPGVGALRFCQLLEAVRQLDPVPALGVRLGLSAQPSQFGVVGYMVSSCGTLGQALARYHRYQGLLQAGLSSRASLQDGVLRMRWTQAVANTPLASEFSLAVFVSLCQALIGRAITPLRAGCPLPDPLTLACIRYCSAVLWNSIGAPSNWTFQPTSWRSPSPARTPICCASWSNRPRLC